jgi:hypothetical protein
VATGILETAKATNPLKDLLKYGQSVWLDYIRRNLLTSGELKRLIEEDGLRRQDQSRQNYKNDLILARST